MSPIHPADPAHELDPTHKHSPNWHQKKLREIMRDWLIPPKYAVSGSIGVLAGRIGGGHPGREMPKC